MIKVNSLPIRSGFGAGEACCLQDSCAEFGGSAISLSPLSKICRDFEITRGNNMFDTIVVRAEDILRSKGIFLIEYPFPNILITQSLDEFNSHRQKKAPDWARAYENDAGSVILSPDFLKIDWLTDEQKSKQIAHELLHAIHDLAVMKSFIGVTHQEMQKFKREFIKEKRHIGLVEGTIEQLSKGDPNWELVFYMINDKGIYDLRSLKKQMFLDQGDTPYNDSYISSHAIVNGICEYINRNKDKFIQVLSEKGIEFISDYEKQYKQRKYQNLTGEAILFRIIVEYMIQMFDLFRKGEEAIDFEIFFTKITGIEFSEVETFAWSKLIEDGKRRGFEIIKKITII